MFWVHLVLCRSCSRDPFVFSLNHIGTSPLGYPVLCFRNNCRLDSLTSSLGKGLDRLVASRLATHDTSSRFGFDAMVLCLGRLTPLGD